MIKDIDINENISWGFFDGACQGRLGVCGAGETLFLNRHQYFYLKYGARRGTNNHVEASALWIFLKFAILERYIKTSNFQRFQIAYGLVQ
jgi:ribonuclease HI